MVRVELGRDELGRRSRKHLYAATEEEAVRLLKRAHRERDQGQLAVSGRDTPKTVGGWLDVWLETVRASREPKTYLNYESVVRVHLKPAFGHRRLSQLGPLEVQRFLDAKGRAMSAASVLQLSRVLCSALGRAERLGLVARNAAGHRLIDLPRAEPATENILTLSEARALLSGIRDDRLYALYLTAVVLGQRQGSLLGLRWLDVAEDYSRIRLPKRLVQLPGPTWQLRPARLSRTKKAPPSLPLPAPVAAALREHRARQDVERGAAENAWMSMEHDGAPVELVFTSPRGMPLYGRNVTRAFQRLLKETGLGHHRFHDLRHSAASVMLALHIPLKVISEVLAHSGIQITADLYMHLDDSVLRDHLAVLDAAWGDDTTQQEAIG